jgi:uncharacterized membrane protein
VITLEHIYILTGLMFAVFAVLGLRDTANRRRVVNAGFWALLAFSFLFGSELGDLMNGILVLGLVVLGTIGLGTGRATAVTAEERQAAAARNGNWLFIPALIVPGAALLGSVFVSSGSVAGIALLDPKHVTLVCLGIGTVVGLAVAMTWLRPTPLAPLEDGARLMNSIGWASILPLMLASLGAVFDLAGIGKTIGALATTWLPLGTPIAAVAAYCIGMALFTAIMGNAFAAFPVMTAAIGLPLIVEKFGGDVVIMGAIGMLSGFCGTLTTPMAANFNIVPAALLELKDRDAVIKAQLPTAFLMLAGNTILMALLVYRF